MSGREPDHCLTRYVFQHLEDADVVEVLRADRCTGWRWEAVRAREAGTALRRVRWLLRSDHLTPRTRGLGRTVVLDPGERARVRRDDHERDVIAVDAVARGLEVFRRHGVLDPTGRHRWRPGGASLTTFATNACIRELSPAVARWRAEHRWRATEELAADDDRFDRLDARGAPTEPTWTAHTFDQALDADPELAALVAAKPFLREALALRYDTQAGWPDIAQSLGLPLSTLRGRKDQLKREVRRLIDARRTEQELRYEPEGGGRA